MARRALLGLLAAAAAFTAPRRRPVLAPRRGKGFGADAEKPKKKSRSAAPTITVDEVVDDDDAAPARRPRARSSRSSASTRRAARRPLAEATASESLFVPAVVAAPMPESTAKRPPRQRKRKAARDAGMIELEIDGVAMRVGRGADSKTVAAVIRALKAQS